MPEAENIVLTDKQTEAFDKVKEFLRGDSSVFILKGYAGTGKTTLLKEIVRYIVTTLHRQPKLMAPTGRAARVLSKKTGYDATTIHRAIYDMGRFESKKVKDVAETEFKVIFQIRKCEEPVIAIVDEASMVSHNKSEQELFQFGTDILLDDLLTYVRPSFCGKVIFVGDPAQLPPVGDNHSYALDEVYFKKMNLKVMSTELTQVLRQGKGSMILENAMQVRDLLNAEKRNRLVFKEKSGEVERIDSGEMIDKYMSASNNATNGESVIIAYTNKIVAQYNKEIRYKKYGKEVPLQAGDSLMVVRNNYHLGLMNGDFTQVISVGNVESQSAPVYIQRGGNKQRVIIKLDFQDVVVLNDMKEPVRCKLILNLLNDDQRALSIDQMKALYINFKIRYPLLHAGSNDFAETLSSDPYYNALQAKYGYAIVGHKSQGGEWKTVFVDYFKRTGLDDDCLRWNYTATTRAQQTLYISNLNDITPLTKFRIDAISNIKNLSPDFRKFGKIEDVPFISPDAPDFLRAKCWCVMQNMENTPYRIKNIIPQQYKECYEIETPDSVERYDLWYKGNGVFLPAKPQAQSVHTPEIVSLLNNEDLMPVVFDYIPSDDLHKQLYSYFKSACDALEITITNVVEKNENYYTVYYFCTSGTISKLQVYFDGNGFIKYGKPSSFIGAEDKELENLVEALKTS